MILIFKIFTEFKAFPSLIDNVYFSLPHVYFPTHTHVNFKQYLTLELWNATDPRKKNTWSALV